MSTFDAMSDSALEMLGFIEAGIGGTRQESELARRYGYRDGDYLLTQILDRDYVIIVGYYPKAYRITPSGAERLSIEAKRRKSEAARCHDQSRKERLEHERWRKDARRSWVQWTVTTVISLAAFFIGAIVEMLTGFVEWVVALLQ